MNEDLSEFIRKTAGDLRSETFLAATGFILEHGCTRMVETGCYRGNPSEGNSTSILGMAAKLSGGILHSFDASPESCRAAQKMLIEFNPRLPVWVELKDSLDGIANYSSPIHFAYLDSLDCDASGAAQRHQLAEVGAVLGKMRPPCAILLDDHDAQTGGKTLLSSRYLREQGWRVLAEGYQILFVRV